MKINNKANLVLLMMMASLLPACEESDYKAGDCSAGSICASTSTFIEPEPLPEPEPEPVPDQTAYIEKDGVTGKVLGSDYWVNAVVCFDNNRNALCDTSEPSTVTFEDGKYSFKASDIIASISSKAPLLARKDIEQDSKGIALYAPTPVNSTNKNINITVFTTLVHSETQFNPYTLANTASAQESLKMSVDGLSIDGFGFANEVLLSGQDYLESDVEVGVDDAMFAQIDAIATSLNQAQSIAATDIYKAVAAMLDSMYQLNTYTTSISLESINAQDIQETAVDIALSTPHVEWEIGYIEEESADLHVQGDYAVVGSKWHNRLIVLNLVQEIPTTLSFNDFAASPDVERDDIDGFTGASEQSLANIRITPPSSVQSVLVGVEKKNKSGSEEGADSGVGLYRANFSNPSDIPFQRFAGVSEGQDFYAFADLNAMSLSSDGSRVALSGGNKKMVVLQVDDFSLLHEFSSDSKYRAVMLNEDGSLAYVSLSAPDRMEILDVTTGTKLTSLATGTEYPKEFKLVQGSDLTKIAWYLGKSNILSIYNVTEPSVEPVLLHTLPAQSNITSFDISPDGTLVIIGSSGSLVVYSIENNTSKVLKTLLIEKEIELVSTPLKVGAIAFTNNNRALIATKNALQTLDISFGEPPSAWSDEKKQAWFDVHRTNQ
ncbi:MAG: WD40 repeat domain-containing protein [Colwellia sp.]|uniref:WD40 repeat domain-containing protein n=1 Tax=Colwellia sp. TaxID=56799 RepID=UPI0025C1CCFB|nr:WD40 repeat domain-containing protein [Colwellia sp.]NQZ27564.1 WD40 repeat domain-containing protein [Colwellia sp.]